MLIIYFTINSNCNHIVTKYILTIYNFYDII